MSRPMPSLNASEPMFPAKDALGESAVDDQSQTSGLLISEEGRLICQWVIYAVLLTLIDTFGIITNIMNIIVFVKQGFKDSVNISLFGLAVSDLGCEVTMLWTSICVNPAFEQSDLPFDAVDVGYLTGGWPHIIFSRFTSWITALITLERCLCITMPLKVKSIITPKRISVTIICLFIVLTCCVSPMFYANNLATVFSPETNQTLIRLIYTDDRAIVDAVCFALNSLFIPFSSFLVVIVCTTILVVKLRNQRRWRQRSVTSDKADVLSDRDQRVSQMVVMISTLFIACFIPLCFAMIAMLVEPGLSVNGKYKNTLYVIVGLGFVLESINSATNIFIYYHGSSRYRKVFRHLFAKDRGDTVSLK